MNAEAWLKLIKTFGVAIVGLVACAWVINESVIKPHNVAQEEARIEAKEERSAAREERKANSKALVDSNTRVNLTNQTLAEGYKEQATAFGVQAETLKAVSVSMDRQTEAIRRQTDEISGSKKELAEINRVQKLFPSVAEAIKDEPKP